MVTSASAGSVVMRTETNACCCVGTVGFVWGCRCLGAYTPTTRTAATAIAAAIHNLLRETPILIRRKLSRPDFATLQMRSTFAIPKIRGLGAKGLAAGFAGVTLGKGAVSQEESTNESQFEMRRIGFGAGVPATPSRPPADDGRRTAARNDWGIGPPWVSTAAVR